MAIQETASALNNAQACIYSRSNIRRAFSDFDDTGVVGIALNGDNCVITYSDGSCITYPRKEIQTAYTAFTHRLKDFFAYLGPNYRGPSIWRHNSYILFKGWHYNHALGHLSSNAQLQRHWADKFIHLTDHKKVLSLLQSEQTDLGHLVAPDGLRLPNQPVDLESDLDEEQEAPKDIDHEPYCSCGSFQRQLLNLSDFQAEIEGFRPWCIHLTWIQTFRDILCKRSELRSAAAAGAVDKCVAWWYAPPADGTSNGRFLLLHTKSGAQAPASHWRTYKPKEIFTQHDAWNLFFNMMEAGYVPYPGTSLPQLQSVFKQSELGKQTAR